MNATTVRKFCTLQEAAERLNATEEQIENLLRRGVLREFRDGPHRLLRTADVGAILAARTRRRERQGQPRTPNDRSTSGRDGGSRLPRSGDAVPRESHPDDERPGTTGAMRSPRNVGFKTPAGSRASFRSSELPRLSDNLRSSRRRTEPESLPPRPSLSVREWFWNGLLQDRPMTIALLSGLVLLALSSLVAGLCWLAETLR
jgi:excisionase family DNA binding protein